MEFYQNRFHHSVAKPLAIGGGTYTKHLKNAAVFGPERPGEVSTIHIANECINIEHLIMDAKVYADAITKLAYE